MKQSTSGVQEYQNTRFCGIRYSLVEIAHHINRIFLDKGLKIFHLGYIALNTEGKSRPTEIDGFIG